MSSPDADRTTTANGLPLSTRAGQHQPRASVTPSITFVLAVEYTSTCAPAAGVPFRSDVTHTPRPSSPLVRTLRPRSERHTRRKRSGL